MPESETGNFLPFHGRVTLFPVSCLQPLGRGDESGMGLGTGPGVVKHGSGIRLSNLKIW